MHLIKSIKKLYKTIFKLLKKLVNKKFKSLKNSCRKYISLFCASLISWMCINQRSIWNVMRVTLEFYHLLGRNSLFECIYNRTVLKLLFSIKSTTIMNISNRFTLLDITYCTHKTTDHFHFLVLGITNLLASELRSDY